MNRVNRKNGVGGVWFRRVDDPIDPRPPVAISSHENPRHLLVRELIWGREGGRESSMDADSRQIFIVSDTPPDFSEPSDTDSRSPWPRLLRGNYLSEGPQGRRKARGRLRY